MFYKVAKVTWTSKDASLYVIPYPDNRPGYLGVAKGLLTSPSFDAGAIGRAGVRPRISIHESGVVHGQVADYRTEQLVGPPLNDPAGGHIATISCFDPVGLPSVQTLRGGREPDVVLIDPESKGGAIHIVLYVALSDRQLAKYPGQLRLALERPTLRQPLLFRFRVRGAEQEGTGGVAVMSGWGPGPADRDVDELVFAVTTP
jgi:hypothetical protein